MHRLRKLTLFFVLVAACLSAASAQTDYSGIYTGTFTIAITGAGQNETVTDEIILTVDSHFNIRIGDDTLEGPVVGSVAADGSVDLSLSTIGLIVTEGTISNGNLFGTNTVTTGPIVQTYTLEAVKTGDISGGVDDPYVAPLNQPTLNPETGRYEQDVIVYSGAEGLTEFQIQVFSLLPSVALVDATHIIRADPTDPQSSIIAYAVDHLQPLAPETEMTFSFEFTVEDEEVGMITAPIYFLNLDIVLPEPTVQGAVTIEKISNAEAVATFTVTTGETYLLRSSGDLIDWDDETEFVADETFWEWTIPLSSSARFFVLFEVEP